MSDRQKLALWGLLLLALLLLPALPGCARKEPVAISRPEVLPANMVEPQLLAYFPGKKLGAWSFTPDRTYAVVNSEWLVPFYNEWRARLFDAGVTKWDSRFDCNRFAASFAASAQLEFYKRKWGKAEKAEALAIGEVWYMPDGHNQGHAINLAITERGALFMEPQSGKFLDLSPEELASITFKRF